MANRWFLDTEFMEDGRTIDLISIALVSDGVEYYAGCKETDQDRWSPWIWKNVYPKLPKSPEFWKPRSTIANDVRELLLGETLEQPEIWADFASYDWVALCQLYGPMIYLPSGLPMFCMDLQQYLRHAGIRRSELPRQDPATEHSALDDARWLHNAWRFANGLNWNGWHG